MDLSIAAWRQAGAKLINADFSTDAEIERKKLGTRSLIYQLKITSGALSGSSVAKVAASPYGGVTFPDANAGTAAFQIPIPDAWEESQDLVIKMYWKATPTSGDAYFTLDYNSAEAGEALTSVATLTSTDTTKGTAEDINETSFTIPASAIKAGDILGIALGRDPTNGADTLSSDVEVLGLAAELTARG